MNKQNPQTTLNLAGMFPVAVRSKMAARLLGSRVRFPLRSWMGSSLVFVFCAVSRSWGDELITC